MTHFHELLSLSTQSQGNILIRTAVLNLASSRRDTAAPNNLGASSVGAGNNHLVAVEGIAKDIRKIVPDGVALKVDGEVGLGLASVETIGLDGDLDGTAAGYGVSREGLAIGTALSKGCWVGDGAANGPGGDAEGALVDDTGLAQSSGRFNECGNGKNGSGGELHVGET